jgi:hypothetical protein
MKKLKIIKLKIVKCDDEHCWYFKKVGQSFYFFDKIFNDDDRYRSIWLATAPTKKYAYIADTNYDIYIRKKKLKKINKNENTI